MNPIIEKAEDILREAKKQILKLPMMDRHIDLLDYGFGVFNLNVLPQIEKKMQEEMERYD